MSQSELAIAGLFDHEDQQDRSVPDWGGDDVFAFQPARRFVREDEDTAEVPHAANESDRATTAVAAEPEIFDDRYLEPVPTGRRTVTITGRPGDRAFDAPRRPARSFEDRIAHAPERIAAWAFGLGVLLILIAILTAN